MLSRTQPDDSEIDARRRAFGAFLRSRRERLTPAAVGLPNGFRRRTPGLRREEVALLAGVGATWYTWLEQGRDVRPSPEVLSALADALHLDAAERAHLFILTDRAPPEQRPTGPERVEEPLHRMLQSLTGQPAYVLGRRWDLLAWNRASEVVFGDYGDLDGDARNIMHLVFANPKHQRLLVDWEEVAKAALATFRADSARYTGDPDFTRLIETLMRTSHAFRAWWPKHEVLRQLSSRKRIRHPIAGQMLFEHTTFAVTEHTDMKLVVYTPLGEADSIAKLEVLLAGARQLPVRRAVSAAHSRQGAP